MEIDLDLNENNWVMSIAVVLVCAILLVSLATIGQRITPVDAMGNPRVMNVDDWRLHQATREYNREIEVLRDDLRDVAQLLQQTPDPIAASILLDRVKRNTKEGQPSSLNARTLTLAATEGVVMWANGTLDRTSAMDAVNAAVEALQ